MRVRRDRHEPPPPAPPGDPPAPTRPPRPPTPLPDPLARGGCCWWLVVGWWGSAVKGGEHHAALRRESLNSGSASSTCVLPSVVCPGKRTPGGCLLSLPPPCVLAAIAVTIVPRTRLFSPSFGFTLLASDSRRLRQSLVAMLLVSLSPVSSQVSAILMVLETWSQGHKNSPSRRGVRGAQNPPSRAAPPGPPGAPRGAPRARRGKFSARAGAGGPGPSWSFGQYNAFPMGGSPTGGAPGPRPRARGKFPRPRGAPGGGAGRGFSAPWTPL